MNKKFSLVSLLVLAFLGSSATSSALAQDNQYLPEYGTLAEHNQWGTKEIDVDKVQDLGIRGAGVKVAVLDSGISLSTPGINTKLYAYKDFLPSQPPLPDHGTQTAGLISSEFDIATGVRGVAPDAQLIVGRVCYFSSCDTSAIKKGILWAVEQGAQVISMSFGGSKDAALHATVLSAVNSGVVIVASAGNNGCQTKPNGGLNRFCKQGVISEGYSASYTIPGLISTGATDQTKARASFSSWGPNLDIVAPGVNNTTYDPVGPTNGFGGTSAATPLVAGVAALVLSVNPELNPQQVQAILQATTKPALAVKPKVWDSCQQDSVTKVWTCNNEVENNFPQEYFTGAGIVSALNAVNLAKQLGQQDFLAKPIATVTGTGISLTWTGGAADLYSNNKLIQRSATSGHTVSGEQYRSYSFQIRRDGKVSEPTLVVLQNPTAPQAPTVIEKGASTNELRITTNDLAAEVDQLFMTSGTVAALFELQDGKQVPCSGYSPSPDGAPKIYYFKCDIETQASSITGSFRLLNKYSQLSPGTSVTFSRVDEVIPPMPVTTTYISSDQISFDWDEVPGALSYEYRYLPTGEFFCTTDTFFSITGKGTQPSLFYVVAKNEANCGGYKIADSEYQPYVLLSATPPKPTGITVKNNDILSVEFDVPNAQPTDQWRIYRSDGAVTRIAAGQRIVLGMQPNEDVNGKTFSYRIMQVINDTWGEVWSEPSDPIVVTIKDLPPPQNSICVIRNQRSTVECSIQPNSEADSTFVEYLDLNGDVLHSHRVSNLADTNTPVQAVQTTFLYAAHSVRVSAITGLPHQWMRRGSPKSVKVRNYNPNVLFVTN
ncbi:MAG: extracellular alkaline serine protease [Actinomycetota bacterium]